MGKNEGKLEWDAGGLQLKGELEVRRGILNWEVGTERILGLSGIAEDL